MLLSSSQLLLRVLACLPLCNFSSSGLCLLSFHRPTPPLLGVHRPPALPALLLSPSPAPSDTRLLPFAPALRNEWQHCRRAARGADWSPGSVTRWRPRAHAGGRSWQGWSGAPGRGAGARGWRSREAGGGRRWGRLSGLPPAPSRPVWPRPCPDPRPGPLSLTPPSGPPGTRAASGAAQADEGRAPCCRR